jgi:molecular chaperone HtpG
MNDQKHNAMEFEYKAEMKQLLKLIVNSLYTNQEIFIRELVSNASDALNKARFRRLTDTNMYQPEKELRIDIKVDKDKELFSIEDSGIGMTKNDLISQIGTVASSGTLEFLTKVKEEKKSLDGNLIGQFGVGFYSVFMVTDQVTIETRHADNNDRGWKWESSGEDKFSIEEYDKKDRGTTISFKLKDDYKEYYEPERVKSILQKYSNFVDFPVYVNGEKVNIVTALWQRSKEDVKEDELNEFYKFISNDYQEPLDHLHLSIEGVPNFKALLFIPQTAPPMLFRDFNEKNLQLYSSNVFIQDDCKELLPDYLKFIRGVVDTEDLSLNVSRETTQHSPVIAKIKRILTGKILSWLEDIAKSNDDKYMKFYNNFGPLFKSGANSDFENKKRILDLLRFESSALKKDEWTSFKDYVSRMGEDQKEIYYVSGEHRELVERNPNLEFFKKKGIEVLLLTDPTDIFTIPYIFDYDGKQLKSIDKADIDVSKDDESPDSLSEDLSKSLIDVFKETLGDKVEDVKASKRLVESPVTLVIGSQGMDAQMEKMMQMLDQNFTSSKRILEVNMSHPLIKNLAKRNIADSSDPMLRNSVMQLYESALLLEGYLKSPNDFVQRMNEFMQEATKVK